MAPAERVRLRPLRARVTPPTAPTPDPRTTRLTTRLTTRRRIRHEARDGLLVAGCSLGLSVGAAGLCWLLAWWWA